MSRRQVGRGPAESGPAGRGTRSAVIAMGEPDGAGDDEHAREVGGQVVMEAVGDGRGAAAE